MKNNILKLTLLSLVTLLSINENIFANANRYIYSPVSNTNISVAESILKNRLKEAAEYLDPIQYKESKEAFEKAIASHNEEYIDQLTAYFNGVIDAGNSSKRVHHDYMVNHYTK